MRLVRAIGYNLSFVICHLSFRRRTYGEPEDKPFLFIVATVGSPSRRQLAFEAAEINAVNAYGRSTDYCCRRVYQCSVCRKSGCSLCSETGRIG
jgi:hypothetical protein